MRKKIAILIPAYNEEKHIAKVIKKCLPFKLDIIIVNDGSTDKTLEKIKSIKGKQNKIILLSHKRNQGKGKSLQNGFNYALKHNYQGIITLDGDDQHEVKEINYFLKEIEKDDFDLVIGSRFQNSKDMPWTRLATNLSTSWVISKIIGKRVEDVQSGFRYLSKKAMENIKLGTNHFDTEPEMVLKAGLSNYKIKNIPIKTIYHQQNQSQINPFTDTVKFFRLIFRGLLWKRSLRRH